MSVTQDLASSSVWQRIFPGTNTRWTSLDYAALFLVLLIGAGLRSIKLDASLWFDESLTYRAACLPFRDVLIHRSYPLYYVLAHWAIQLGDNEIMLRLPSVFAGLAGIAALYGFGRSVGGRGFGFVSSLLLAVNVYHIDHSQQARYYAWVMLATVLCTWSMWKAMQTNHVRYWILFVLAGNVGVASQQTIVPYLASLTAGGIVYTLLVPAEATWKRRMIRSGTAAACGLLTLTAYAGASALHGAPEYIVQDDDGDDEVETEVQRPWHTAVRKPAGGEFRLEPIEYAVFLETFVPGAMSLAFYAWLAFLVVGCVALGFTNRPLSLLIFSQLVLAPLPFFILAMTHWFRSRYFCSILPFFCMWEAAGMIALAYACGRFVQFAIGIRSERVQCRLQIASVALLILAVTPPTIGQLSLHFDGIPRRDWKAVAQYAAADIQSGSLIGLSKGLATEREDTETGWNQYRQKTALLKLYLEREYNRLYPGMGASMVQSLRFVRSATAREARRLVAFNPDKNIYFIASENQDEGQSAIDNSIDGVHVYNVNGLVLRKVVRSDSDGTANISGH